MPVLDASVLDDPSEDLESLRALFGVPRACLPPVMLRAGLASVGAIRVDPTRPDSSRNSHPNAIQLQTRDKKHGRLRPRTPPIRACGGLV